MDNILRMIDAAMAATGQPVALLVELYEAGGYSAALVEATTSELRETITSPNDWQIDLAASADSIREAVAALDALCAEGLA